MEKPFVLSEDVEMLMKPWAEARGFVLPSSAFFAGLLDAMLGLLRGIFAQVVLAEESYISDRLCFRAWIAAKQHQLTVVSMDGVYFRSKHTIAVNRSVDRLGNDAGLKPRPGALSFEEQISLLRRNGLTEIVLVDDVIFSGNQMSSVIRKLAKAGVQVNRVLSGVSVGMGERRLRKIGVECSSVCFFPEVTDEICQRDLLPGIPRSGRTVAGAGNVGMPYILPFGNPGKWASIPKAHQEKFSRQCTGLAIDLFEGIEKASGRPVLCSDLDRSVFSLPQNDTRFVDALKQLL
jgi:hypothetical protein